MKEEILKVLEESSRSLDVMTIVSKLKSSYTSNDIKEVEKVLNQMCIEGILYQRKDGNYMLFSRSNLIKGKLEIANAGYGFVLLEGEDLFIPKDNLRNASDGDIVIAEVTSNKGKKKEGRILRILERDLGSNLAEVYIENNEIRVKPLSKDLNLSYILETKTPLIEGQIVKIKVLREISRRQIVVDIDKIIGHKNAPETDILVIVNEFEIPYEFSEETLEEARNMPYEITSEMIASELNNGRLDKREESIFTIDGSDTKDIDDAISLKILKNGNYLLGVHIADLSYYVKKDSMLWKEAELRGNSVYLANKVIPMFPVELSNGICSLNPNVDRFTTSCEMEINSDGNVVNYNIYKGIINSKKKMTYECVNKLFEEGECEGYESFKDTLFSMLELSKIIKKNKRERGELEFLGDEIKLEIDENNKVIGIKRREQKLAEKLIEDFMVVANETIATHINNQMLPFVYRVHDKPSEKKITDYLKFISILGYQIQGKLHLDNIKPKDLQHLLDSLKDKPYYKVLNKKLLRSMQKAIYDVVNIGHFGLASTCYTHFTSPIRRFSDLLVHYSINEYEIKNNYNNSFLSEWENYLNVVTDHVSKTERTAESCEYEVDDMLVAEYMESHIGDEYEGYVDGVLNKGFFVETLEGISGFVSLDTLKDYYIFKDDLMGYTNRKNKVVLRVGDKVKVKCIGASKEKREVDFTLV